MEAAEEPQQRAVTADLFVTQVNWLIASVGGKDQLVQRCGGLVSVRTLDNWSAGNYPRSKVTGAVRDLDAWASEHVPGYPAAAGAPRLVDSCGPHRSSLPNGSTAAAVAAGDGATPADTAPATPVERPGKRGWVRWALAGAVLVLVAVGTAVTTVAVVRHHDAGRAAADAQAAAESVANAPLPSTGTGEILPEQSGSIGANTFADPRTLVDRAQPIPPHTTVMVRCRYYAPSIPSVTPDGFWYLIDSGPWAGRWTPANSYMNGDVPGGPTLHNTDFAVPVCH